MSRKYLPVPDSLAGERLDVLVARMLGLSRSAAAELAEAGRIEVDDRVAAKSARPPMGAVIAVELPDPVRPEAPAAEELQQSAVIGLRVLYSDDDVAVIDKPVGVAAHASPGWTGPTVTGGLAALGIDLARSGAAEREGIVHRLDVGTSGLMVVALSDRAYSSLKDQFRERTVDKVYHALVQGHPDPSSGTIDAPIDRHPTADHRFAVVTGGRPSITHYDTIEAFPYASLVEVHLETGRTHQIRVHFSALRHPCCGDLTYGADPSLAKRLGLTRQWLHAHELEFEHPGTGERVRFESDYPDDLAHALEVISAPMR
ncbi:MAG: rRNA synthase [Actinomycetota bacterium]|nr:rRNA synthase [Actinomycetota bacterium]